VKALTFGLTLNGGATCMAPKRVFVARSIATEFEGRLAQHHGNSRRQEAPCSPGKSQGHLTSAATNETPAFAPLRPLLEDALARGAHFIVGDEQAKGAVILGGVASSSRLLREDIFVPVLALVTVADDREAILRANDCPFALTASIFSSDESAARRLAAQIKAGVVTINDLIIPTADARVPFGGRGRSGFGVTRGGEGLLELTAPKVVTLSGSKFRPAFDTPRPEDERMFQAYLKLTHGRGFRPRCRALLSLIRTISSRRNTSKQKTQ